MVTITDRIQLKQVELNVLEEIW